MDAFHERLLQNQVVLHARTRPLREVPGARCFESPTRRLRYWLLERQVTLPADLREVRTLPGAQVSEAVLRAEGFVPSGKLRFFWREVPDRIPAARADLEVVCAGGARWPEDRERYLHQFSLVQQEGYATRDGVGTLEETLRRNRESARHEDETFYLARVGGEPASAMRTFFADRLLGIYGVATRPAFQKRGLATELLNRAFVEARERGAELLTLQTWAESAPERLYRALAFVAAFDLGLYVRKEQ
jgi:GNAT superfamily N-acetyltransferase